MQIVGLIVNGKNFSCIFRISGNRVVLTLETPSGPSQYFIYSSADFIKQWAKTIDENEFDINFEDNQQIINTVESLLEKI